MPLPRRPRRQPTDDWQQLRLLVTSPEQETYELVRPILLFGQPPDERARETGVSESTLRRKAARVATQGLLGLFTQAPSPDRDQRRLPPEIRRAIAALKAEYPPFSLREIAAICRASFGRPVDHRPVRRVLATEPLPLDPPRRFPRYRDIADPVARRTAIVDLYHDGWSPRAIAGYLATSRARVHDALKRWDEEGWNGLPDRSRPLVQRRRDGPQEMVDVQGLEHDRRVGEPGMCWLLCKPRWCLRRGRRGRWRRRSSIHGGRWATLSRVPSSWREPVFGSLDVMVDVT